MPRHLVTYSVTFEFDNSHGLTVWRTDRHGRGYKHTGEQAWTYYYKFCADGYSGPVTRPKFKGTLEEVRNRYIMHLMMQGLSADAIAAELGVTRRCLTNWRRGEITPDRCAQVEIDLLHGTMDDIRQRYVQQVMEECNTYAEMAARLGISDRSFRDLRRRIEAEKEQELEPA